MMKFSADSVKKTGSGALKAIQWIFYGLVYVLLFAPLLIMMVYSFNATDSTFVFGGFSLRWYEAIFSDYETLNALSNTLVLAVLASLISTVFGTFAAVGMYKLRNKYIYNTVNTVTNIPMMSPDIVTGVSMMLLFMFMGRSLLHIDEPFGFPTLLIAHVTFCLPYVILNVLPKLRQTDVHLYEAALDLGCTPISAFFKVVLPAIIPGIISGAMMAFTLSIDDFVISYFNTTNDFQTLPIKLYNETRRGLSPDMYALSTLLFVGVLVMLVLINVFQEAADRKTRGVKK